MAILDLQGCESGLKRVHRAHAMRRPKIVLLKPSLDSAPVLPIVDGMDPAKHGDDDHCQDKQLHLRFYKQSRCKVMFPFRCLKAAIARGW